MLYNTVEIYIVIKNWLPEDEMMCLLILVFVSVELLLFASVVFAFLCKHHLFTLKGDGF